MSFLNRIAGALGLAAALGACSPAFRVNTFPSELALYEASLGQFQKRKWDNAVLGFERLTLELPARDSLLPLSHYYLGMAHKGRGEDLLAAQSLVRLVESFPGDTLADDALYEAARSYQRLWRKPELDPQYGLSAIQAYETLVTTYPDSPLRPQAERQIATLHDWLARKDFETADYYFRRRAYDSAIIYYQDVIRDYPDTPTARRASFRMLEIYRKLNYAEEAEEVCRGMRDRYPGDADVLAACGAPREVVPPTAPPDTVGPAPGSRDRGAVRSRG